MMTVTVLCVGKLKEAYWREAVEEYSKRLSSFCKIQIIEVEESRIPDNPSDAQIAQAIREEGKRLEEKIPPRSYLVSLCIEGKELTSPDLAARLGEISAQSSQLTFVIGGSYGLWEEIKERSQLKLSMSRMTFPHQMARVLLLEQIYRAFSILGNRKYHK